MVSIFNVVWFRGERKIWYGIGGDNAVTFEEVRSVLLLFIKGFLSEDSCLWRDLFFSRRARGVVVATNIDHKRDLIDTSSFHNAAPPRG